MYKVKQLLFLVGKMTNSIQTFEITRTITEDITIDFKKIFEAIVNDNPNQSIDDILTNLDLNFTYYLCKYDSRFKDMDFEDWRVKRSVDYIYDMFCNWMMDNNDELIKLYFN